MEKEREKERRIIFWKRELFLIFRNEKFLKMRNNSFCQISIFTNEDDYSFANFLSAQSRIFVKFPWVQMKINFVLNPHLYF